MNRLVLILGLIGALVAPSAMAANWRKNCQSSSSQDNHSIAPGAFACAIPASATDDTGILDVSGCENIDILFWDDVDGDGTLGGATIQAKSCPTIDALRSATDAVQDAACWTMENLTLDGLSAGNTEAIYGIAANWIKITMVAYATTTEPVQVEVRCNGTWR